MSKTTQTIAARQARNQKRAAAKAGDIEELRGKLWELIRRLDQEFATAPNGLPTNLLRHGHLMVQLGGLYIRACEAGEVEARVQALEEEIFGRMAA